MNDFQLEFLTRKRELWYRQNKIDEDNMVKIKNLLIYFNIKLLKLDDCKEIIHNGESCLIVKIELETYRIDIDKENMCLILLQRNSDSSIKEKYRRLYDVGTNGSFAGCDCWFNVFQYLSQHSIINNVKKRSIV